MPMMCLHCPDQRENVEVLIHQNVRRGLFCNGCQGDFHDRNKVCYGNLC